MRWVLLVCGLSMHREYDVVRFQEGKGGCASDSDSESQFPEWPAHMLSLRVPRPDDMILHCPHKPTTDPSLPG